MQNQVLNIVVQRNVSSGSKKTFAPNKQRPSKELCLQRFEEQTRGIERRNYSSLFLHSILSCPSPWLPPHARQSPPLIQAPASSSMLVSLTLPLLHPPPVHSPYRIQKDLLKPPTWLCPPSSKFPRPRLTKTKLLSTREHL